MNTYSLKSKGTRVLSALLGGIMLFGTVSTPASVPNPVQDTAGTVDLRAAAAGDCVIDTGTTYQNIRGFGGINHPEWAGDLTASQRETAFGNGENQLGFTILRVFVNPDKSQWSKALPTAQYASQHDVTVFASPWEPPSSIAESGNGKGKLHLNSNNYAAYATHLNDFGTYMKQNGVDLYSISVQNEPDYASEWTYWSTDEVMNFIANYGDRITSTRLMSAESFQYSPDGASWINGGDGGKRFYKKIINNSKAMANCDVFGTHFYGTTREWMDYPDFEKAIAAAGKELWMTEVYVPNSDANSSDRFPEALAVAENIHNGMCVSNLSAYVWWYIRRQYGPMNENGTISKRGAMMAQYSKWVRPGAKRIAATEFPEGKNYVAMDTKNGNYGNLQTMVSAYQLDDQITVVAINPTPTAKTQNFSISSGEKIFDIEAYHTTGSENIKATAAPSFSDSSFSASLPAQSVTTFVIKTGEAQPDPNGYLFHYTFESSSEGFTGRGNASVATGSEAYEGSKGMYVSGRESSWHGATHALPGKLKAGQTYSFSAVVKYTTGDALEKFHFSVEYTGTDGETHYDKIDSQDVPKGEWVQLANTAYTVPAGATNVKIYFETESTIDFYVDEVIGAPEGTAIDGPRPAQITLGDLNDDGVITAVDLSLAKALLKAASQDSTMLRAADVTKDGKFNSTDITWYVQYLTGQITAFGKVNGTTTGGEEVETHTMRTISEYTPVVAASVKEYDPESERVEKAGVQYGTVKKASYYSTTCNREKPYYVLLPAGYDESKKYPVLYVMHGYWENEERMIIKGNGTMYTRQLIGNAIASGEAEDMIVVFPYVYSSATQASCSAMDEANNQAYDNFINDLTKDLMPHIEKTYSVKTGRENTALTGFSMGGREGLYIGTHCADKFGYIGAICPAPGANINFSMGSEDKMPSLIFITAGSNDQTVYTTPEGYHNDLTKNNIPHVWHYVNGGYHGDNSIHAHIYNFVRAVFKA